MASERENFAISDLDSYVFSGNGAESENLTSYIYTDRPVYRPNQKVYFKGILRRQTERGYQTPGGTVSVSVENADNTKIFEREMTLSSRGTFSGEVDIPEDAPLGNYSVTAATDYGTASGYFEVQEYKKPEFKVTVSAPQRFVPTGTQMKFNVSARYFFGSPVTRADVKYYIYRERYYPYFSDPAADPLDSFGVSETRAEAAKATPIPITTTPIRSCAKAKAASMPTANCKLISPCRSFPNGRAGTTPTGSKRR
jgi:uncharacterized protein YfaS (alpha-2-macroglobulin family)